LRTATAAVVITLLALAAWFWAAYQAREAKRNAAESELHRAEAEAARIEAEAARTEEEAARAKAEAALRDVFLNQIRANRQSGWSGQRFESLRMLHEASISTNTVAFRNEAIAALSLPDIRPFRSLPLARGSRAYLDRQLRRYATNDQAGAIFVRSADDDRLLQYLPSPGAGVYKFGFAEDDRKIGASYLDRRFAVWDLSKFSPPPEGTPLPHWTNLSESVRPVRILLPPGANAGTGVPDGSELAVVCQDGRIHFLNPTNGVSLRILTLDLPVTGIRFNPSGLKFAGARSNDCFIYRASSGEKLFVLPHPAPVSYLAWHPDGRRLATACYDFKVRIWDTLTGQQTSGFEDHEAEASSVEFDETGTLLASGAWDDSTRLWAPETGQALVRARGSGNALRLAANGSRISYTTWDNGRLVLLDVHPGHEFVSFERFSGIYGLTFSPDGRFVVAGSAEGFHIWQWPFFHPVATLPVRDCARPVFLPDGSRLYAGGHGVVAELPFAADEASGTLNIGPLRELIEMPSSQSAHLFLSPDPTVAAVNLDDRIDLYRRDGERWEPRKRLDGKGQMVVFGPDPRWFALQRGLRRLEVFDQEFRVVTNFDCVNASVTRFSPDGHWLVMAMTNGYQTRRLGSWEPGPVLSPTTGLIRRECLAFAKNAGLVAVRTGDREVELKTSPGWETVASVSIPLTTTAVALSPDGQFLGAAAEKMGLRVWDLGRLRQGLASIGLDWASSPAPENRPMLNPGPMLRPMVQVDALPRLTNESPAVAQRIPPRPAAASPALLDLSNYYNASLADGWIPPFELGATSDYNLPMPLGTNRWAGVDFDVRGAIQLTSSTLTSRHGNFPRLISGIPVGRRARIVNFLHGADWKVRPGTAIGGYFVRYVTGEEEVVRIVYGRDVLDWWAEPEAGTNAPVVAWTGSNPASRRQNAAVHVYRLSWENPRWDIPIQSITFVSSRTASGPFLLAISVE
jgi:WD40 repeat protein